MFIISRQTIDSIISIDTSKILLMNNISDNFKIPKNICFYLVK